MTNSTLYEGHQFQSPHALLLNRTAECKLIIQIQRNGVLRPQSSNMTNAWMQESHPDLTDFPKSEIASVQMYTLKRERLRTPP